VTVFGLDNCLKVELQTRGFGDGIHELFKKAFKLSGMHHSSLEPRMDEFFTVLKWLAQTNLIKSKIIW